MKMLTRREVLGSLAGVASFRWFRSWRKPWPECRPRPTGALHLLTSSLICHRLPSSVFRVTFPAIWPERFTATAPASGTGRASRLHIGSTATVWCVLFRSATGKLR